MKRPWVALLALLFAAALFYALRPDVPNPSNESNTLAASPLPSAESSASESEPANSEASHDSVLSAPTAPSPSAESPTTAAMPGAEKPLPVPAAPQPSNETLESLGWSFENMKNDYETGILCHEKQGRRSFFLDLRQNKAVWFTRSGEGDSGPARVLWWFPQKITQERIGDRGYRFTASSFRPDLGVYYLIEATSSARQAGVGYVYVSRKFPPLPSDQESFYLCVRSEEDSGAGY